MTLKHKETGLIYEMIDKTAKYLIVAPLYRSYDNVDEVVVMFDRAEFYLKEDGEKYFTKIKGEDDAK